MAKMYRTPPAVDVSLCLIQFIILFWYMYMFIIKSGIGNRGSTADSGFLLELQYGFLNY